MPASNDHLPQRSNIGTRRKQVLESSKAFLAGQKLFLVSTSKDILKWLINYMILYQTITMKAFIMMKPIAI